MVFVIAYIFLLHLIVYVLESPSKYRETFNTRKYMSLNGIKEKTKYYKTSYLTTEIHVGPSLRLSKCNNCTLLETPTPIDILLNTTHLCS